MILSNKIAAWRLRKSDHPSQRQYMSLSDIRSIHLLYAIDKATPAETRIIYDNLYAILDSLTERGIQAYATVWVRRSLVEQKRMNLFVLQPGQCNWLTQRPDKQFTQQFLDHDSEVLINLSSRNIYPLEYLTAASRSLFKIALRRQPQGAIYDFLFCPASFDALPKELLDNILMYLDKIKSK